MERIMDVELPGKYCAYCPYLEPKVEEETSLYAGGKLYQKGKKYIVCENSYLCEHLLTYLQGYMNNK